MHLIKQFFNKNFFVIFFLGLASGLPLASILSTLKVLLLEQGFDLKVIGFLSTVTIPYSLKIFFAPILDSFSVPYLTRFVGQRRAWIIVTQILLMIFIFMLGQVGIQADLTLIIICSFSIAFISASQDIVIDAYRIELFEKKDQGLAATCFTYGYHLGLLISGAFALFLADKISWDKVYFVMSCFMIIGILATLFASDSHHKILKEKYNFFSWFKNYIVAPVLDFIKHKQWYFIILFIISFKLADVFASALSAPFLVILEFTKTEIATIFKTFGLVATLLGVLAGGILVKKLGNYKSLWIAALAQMFSNLAYAYLAKIGHDTNTLYLVVFIENFSGGMGTAISIAYLSSLCNVAFSATQYAVLTSFASAGRSFLSSSAGIFVDMLGWQSFFIFTVFLAIPSLIFLWILRKR